MCFVCHLATPEQLSQVLLTGRPLQPRTGWKGSPPGRSGPSWATPGWGGPSPSPGPTVCQTGTWCWGSWRAHTLERVWSCRRRMDRKTEKHSGRLCIQHNARENVDSRGFTTLTSRWCISRTRQCPRMQGKREETWRGCSSDWPSRASWTPDSWPSGFSVEVTTVGLTNVQA